MQNDSRVQDVKHLVPAEKDEDADDVEVGCVQGVHLVRVHDAEAAEQRQSGGEGETHHL